MIRVLHSEFTNNENIAQSFWSFEILHMAVIITQIIHCCYDAGQEVVPESVLVMFVFCDACWKSSCEMCSEN